MLGDKIKKIRNEKGMTQKDLADKLFVTAQAVSRWENNEVEPSVSTVFEIAKIFNVTVGELLGEEAQQTQEELKKEEKAKETASTQVEAPKVVLAVCEQCNKPIYNGSDIVRKTDYITNQKIVICKDCDTKNKKKEHASKVYYGVQQRKKSFLWGGIFSGIILLICLWISIGSSFDVGTTIAMTVVGLLFFPFISCLYLHNNFVMEMFATIATWSVRFPGLIFTLDLDGIVWLLTVKLMFWILGAMISICCFILATALSLVVSPFVYPFALTKSLRHPELAEK